MWSILYIWGTNKYETPCRGNEAIFAVVEKSCFAASQYNEVHFLAMMAILGWNLFSGAFLFSYILFFKRYWFYFVLCTLADSGFFLDF